MLISLVIKKIKNGQNYLKSHDKNRHWIQRQYSEEDSRMAFPKRIQHSDSSLFEMDFFVSLYQCVFDGENINELIILKETVLNNLTSCTQ